MVSVKLRFGFTTSVGLIFPLLLPLSFIPSLYFSLFYLCGLLLSRIKGAEINLSEFNLDQFFSILPNVLM